LKVNIIWLKIFYPQSLKLKQKILKT
jgi:hypothetical protein